MRKWYALFLLVIYTTATFGITMGQHACCASSPILEELETCCEKASEPEVASCCEETGEIAVEPLSKVASLPPHAESHCALHLGISGTLTADHTCCGHCGEYFVDLVYQEPHETQVSVTGTESQTLPYPVFDLPSWLVHLTPLKSHSLELARGPHPLQVVPEQAIYLIIRVLRL